MDVRKAAGSTAGKEERKSSAMFVARQFLYADAFSLYLYVLKLWAACGLTTVIPVQTGIR